MVGYLSGAACVDVCNHSLLQEFSFAGYTPGLYCYNKGNGIWEPSEVWEQFRISLYGALVLEWRGKTGEGGD